jgi:hypothetical protein
MVSDDELKGMILHKLSRQRKWGESHTAFENVEKGVPSHLKGKCKELATALIKEGFLVQKPTGYGLQISLNFGKREEILHLIKTYLQAKG